MQPYLKKAKEVSVSVPSDKVKRAPDSESGDDYDVMDSASDDLISAIHSKDTKAVSAALRAAHELHNAHEADEESHDNE